MGDCTSGVTVSAYLQCLLPSAEGSATAWLLTPFSLDLLQPTPEASSLSLGNVCTWSVFPCPAIVLQTHTWGHMLTDSRESEVNKWSGLKS